MKRLPWGHKSRHCVFCGLVGPRVPVLGGYAHRRCIQEPMKDSPRPPLKRAPKTTGSGSGDGDGS